MSYISTVTEPKQTKARKDQDTAQLDEAYIKTKQTKKFNAIT